MDRDRDGDGDGDVAKLDSAVALLSLWMRT